jgi:hypothetical protein
MDPGARVYSGLLNAFMLYLGKLDPALSPQALTASLKLLDDAGVRYRLDEGVLTVTDSKASARKAMYEALLAYASAFEQTLGVGRTWGVLKTATLKALQGSREDIRGLGLEVPVVKYDMECMLLETLFGFKPSDFRRRKWIKGAVLVTNHRLVLPSEGGYEEVPLQTIATLNREIYVGYSPEVARGSIRAIDYQADTAGMSCAIILARDEVLGEFRRIVSMLRAEYRRLAQRECRVLLALNGDIPLNQLARACGMSQGDVEAAMRRLVELRYAEPRGRLTSYGINAAVELQERAVK